MNFCFTHFFLSNSCFTDYENNLPTRIHYFADYYTTRGGGGLRCQYLPPLLAPPLVGSDNGPFKNFYASRQAAAAVGGGEHN